ncbi:hypothetical protein [Synergistes jonesii]|uniref:hypothetical protein n=1 Tax=Synergistes jonesii TaxID=2754 RepID=UPI0024317E38|nr:hypothetical protein [Synergistes jonesii]
METLFILTNSPGELSGWLAPAAAAAAAKAPGLRVSAVTLPCPYASGRELESALRLRGVSSASTFGEAMRRGAARGGNIILQLGGDPMYGWALSRRLRAPWTIYTARPRWRGSVAHYFIPDEGARRRFEKASVEEARCTVTGDLMLDSVPERGACRPEDFLRSRGLEGEKLICFMAGSRPFEYGQTIGFFSECARALYERYPSWRAIFPLAPTVDEKILREGIESAGFKWRGGGFAEEIEIFGGRSALLVRENHFDAIAASSLAVALPGTNNLQIASLGVPLFVAAPLNRAEEIPLDGIAGAIPADNKAMRALKKKLVFYYNGREKFVSLPNRICGRALVAERRELMTPESAFRCLSELIEEPAKREKIRENYSALSLKRGAAERIVAKILELLRA